MALPARDLPTWSAVIYYFTLWPKDGLDQRIQELLRYQVREKDRRLEDPSLVVIDTRSVRAAAGVPKTTTGLDANKRPPGRKRELAASAHDNAASTALLDQAAERSGNRLEKALVDQGFKNPWRAAGRHRRGRPPQPGRPGQRLRPADRAVGRRAGQRHVAAAPASGTRVRPPARQLRLPRLLSGHREHDPPPHHTHPGLARPAPGGRMNVTERLADLRARHDEATARADELRGQIERLATVLAEPTDPSSPPPRSAGAVSSHPIDRRPQPWATSQFGSRPASAARRVNASACGSTGDGAANRPLSGRWR